ncbi:MAG: hypothetical protein M1813_005234 [Trichoglossum hirsutum]|nr:MAG: hypothetical protein M1813_005234 [Trichoglossum hirsutum]
MAWRTSVGSSSVGTDEKAPPAAPVVIVDWEGTNDAAKPLNWPATRKWAHVAVVSALTLLAPLASSMFAPGVPALMVELHRESSTLSSFVVSVYVLGIATGPLVIAPLSEHYGRLPFYHITNALFILFTVVCALAPSLTVLIVFRFLAGCAGAAPLVLGAGTVADLFAAEVRGKVMSIYTLGVLLGPVIGPIAGGFVADRVGWRWVFWTLAIAGGVVSLSAIPILRETYPPILLRRKMLRLQKAGPPGIKYATPFSDSTVSRSTLFKRAIVRPMKMLFFSPIVLLLSIYIAIIYAFLYLIFSTITIVFEEKYHFSPGVVGLSFIGIGVGMFSGLLAFGAVSDNQVNKRAAAAAAAAAASGERGGVGTAGELKPEYRLYPMIHAAFAIPIGLFWYGWSVDKDDYWIMPMIGTAVFGLGLVGIYSQTDGKTLLSVQMPTATYLVDAYSTYAASAMAANVVLRSLVGAVLPIAGLPLYSALGLGWGNSLLGFISLLGCVVPFLFIRYGEYLRTDPRFKVEF